MRPGTGAASRKTTDPRGWDYALEATVNNWAGLHARPAALLCGLFRSSAEDTTFGIKRAHEGVVTDLGQARDVGPLDLVRLGVGGYERLELFASGRGAADLLRGAAQIVEDGYELLGYAAQLSGYERTVRRLTSEMGMAPRDAVGLYCEAALAMLGGFRGEHDGTGG